ncbi:hypothetical protein Ae201684_005856 [Aphanomyces euteiches]|uniref:Reverse transcriptase domain-containing protein n=1 Tax=Aphanomyces euteiches TaxID=100861 RepID=A0A6G0XDP0_9STRA|nr:hypothetical protein Ae201684_005856 [Aphanomyces euteiches]
MVLPASTPSPDPALQEVVINHVSASLSTDQRRALDSPIRASELCAAIKTMRKNKLPGLDGWPVVFFQTAPEIFAAILCIVFEYQRKRHGCLLPHQRTSSITLLYKKGERNPGNYRPIALMPVEVKILSRVLAYRLSAVADTLVHPSQAGFEGRNLTDHIHLIQALQHKATRNNEEWYATFLDFAKAYDMVRWPFLFAVMSKMNIGPEFLDWVRLLYRNPEVHLLLNGAPGPTIRPNRGVKQGCPLSCLLFDLYLEPLGAMLRACPEAGIQIDDDTRLTGVYFADDSTLLSGSLESAEYQVDEIVGKFCAVSGAALNRTKCITLALNNNEEPIGRASTPSITLAASGQPIRFLGAYVGHRLPPNYHAQQINDKYLAAFAQWHSRARTIQGRRTLASSLILGLVWHVTAVTPIPAAMIETWQRILNNYIAGGKTAVDPKYRLPINSSWMCDKVLGLGIPT